jgi:A/G-specific adenine glycosylase
MSPWVGKPFSSALIAWQQAHGRQHLPWQHTGSAYKVWLSEIMLQQTQVSTVLGYYARFLEAFPTVEALANAPDQQVMQLWAGLGYYSRARNLHACAKAVVARFEGVFPGDVAQLETLPGIGPSTAGAIASLAHGVPAAILDGNVKRVFCRYYGVQGHPEQAAVKKQLWNIARANVPQAQAGVYNQALMDLGATCCVPRNPKCGQCPLQASCVALEKGLTAQLPTPKPKKSRSELFFLSLLAQDSQGRWLLQFQPDKGVWQDLWAFPSVQCESEPTLRHLQQASVAWKQALGGLDRTELNPDALLDNLQAQPWLVHELTHRKMHFKAVVLKMDEPQCGFVALCDKPVPKVVHKLIAHGFENGSAQ